MQANWKIVLENYNECLHCPTIHPELVAVVPAYRKGSIFESGREDGGVTLADGRTAMVTDPRLRLPLLPGFKGQGDPEAYYGAGVYPTMFLDVDGSTCLATAVFPTGPRSCRLVTEYLFSPEALEDPEFDPSPVVEFNELVTRQDNEACERVQRGVTSRAFDHGVFPAKDAWVHGFDERYLRDVEALTRTLTGTTRASSASAPVGAGEHRVDLELGQLGVRPRRRARRALISVGERVEVDRRAAPGAGAAAARRAATAAGVRAPSLDDRGERAARCRRAPRRRRRRARP